MGADLQGPLPTCDEPSMSDEPDDSDTAPSIVIEVGTFETRIGFSDTRSIMHSFPSLVGHRHMCGMVGMSYKDKYVGDEVLASTSWARFTSIKCPCTDGVITNWEVTEKILHHAFYNVLRAAPEDHPVLIVLPDGTPTRVFEKLTILVFETFNAVALHIVPTSIAVLHDAGRTTGCVLDVGTASARFSAVVNRRVEVTVKSRTLGVSAVCDSLRDLVMSEASFKAQPLWFTGTVAKKNRCKESGTVNLTNVYPPQPVVDNVDTWSDFPGADRDGNPFGFRHEFGGRLSDVSASLLRPPSTLESLSVGDEVEFVALDKTSHQQQHRWQGGLAGEVKRVVRIACPPSSADSAAAAIVEAAAAPEEEAEHLVFWGNHLYTYGDERWGCTDFLFEQKGLPSLITDSVVALDDSTRRAILSNLAIAGSIASLPNFEARLRNALDMPRARSVVGLSAFFIARERRGDGRFASIGAASGMRILAMMAEKIPRVTAEEDLLQRRAELADDSDDTSDVRDPSFAAWRGGMKMAAAHFLRYEDGCSYVDKEALAFWVTKEEYDEVGPIVAMTTAEEGGKCDYGCFALLPLKAGWYEVEVDSTAPESAVYKSYYANPATGESTWKRPI